MQYVGDLLICCPTKEQFEKDLIAVLTALATGGHRVRLYIWVGAPSQVEAIANAQKPSIVEQTLSFLGMVG